MKLKLMGLIVVLSIFTVACTTNQSNNLNQPQTNTAQPTVEVVDFTSCVKAGNPILKSNPPQCRHQGITYTEESLAEPQEIKCRPEQRQAEVCAEIYQPVCGKVNVQCIKAPCPPLPQTFSNACDACRNSLVESYTEGECQTN